MASIESRESRVGVANSSSHCGAGSLPLTVEDTPPGRFEPGPAPALGTRSYLFTSYLLHLTFYTSPFTSHLLHLTFYTKMLRVRRTLLFS